ncbi:DUF402 domain-containing protein [Nocardioides abyssi]|uniref:DUF402 domain-containing protein n=1 Tax=Nocardioides abyssi TaxID=3058370 RepID=A0ABT8EPJ8_9ACTN|nr:DUF402 domain-containing protein [Nocardioides abyssi]MDN4160039.1 DUF402 domain-containing protein [Nocardioides abyssi]
MSLPEAPPPAPAAGSRAVVAMTKWGDRPHWTFAAVVLGSDHHGDWLGLPAGTTLERPGATYVAPTDQVVLVPAPGPDLDRAWVATFHGAGGPLEAYVDITTPPVWDGATLRAVDLDLDVLRGLTGRTWVDDEDEFAEHRVALAYPDDVCTLAVASCERVHALAAAGHPPYDGTTARAWLARL